MNVRFVGLLLSFSLLAVSPRLLLAQRCGLPLSWRTLGERIDLLHNLNTKKEVAQPAYVQWVRPANAKAVASIGGGLRIDACTTALVSVGPFVEYLWTTESGKRQNTMRAGLDADWQLRPIGARAAAWTPLVLLQGNVKSDNERHERGVQLDVRVTPVMANQTWPAPNGEWEPGPAFALTYSPNLGVILDHIGTAVDSAREGSIVRGLAQLDLSVFPAPAVLNRRVELAASVGYRHDLSDGTNELDNDHALVRAALNIFFVREADRAAGLSIIHTRGDEPSRGYARVQEWKLALTLRIR
jgi:hypothetical protein